MPLVVLARGRPLDAVLPDWPVDAFEQRALANQQDLATLVPKARLSIARQSAHFIQQDQPALVIEAIRQVVAGVRSRTPGLISLRAARRSRSGPINRAGWLYRGATRLRARRAPAQ